MERIKVERTFTMEEVVAIVNVLLPGTTEGNVIDAWNAAIEEKVAPRPRRPARSRRPAPPAEPATPEGDAAYPLQDFQQTEAPVKRRRGRPRKHAQHDVEISAPPAAGSE